MRMNLSRAVAPEYLAMTMWTVCVDPVEFVYPANSNGFCDARLFNPEPPKTITSAR